MAARWYIVQVYSNFEKSVKKSLEEMIAREKLQEVILQIEIPMEKVVEIKKGGEKKPSERKFFPGYILVKMEMSEEAWHKIKNTPKVSGFLGAKERPTPMSDAEAARILKQMTDGVEEPKTLVSFEIGEQIRITDGAFASFVGQVEEVDATRARIKASVSIFGRATPVELEYGQVEKV